MTTHTFKPDHWYNTIGSHPPVLRVADGDTIITTTVDAWGLDEQGAQAAPRGIASVMSAFDVPVETNRRLNVIGPAAIVPSSAWGVLLKLNSVWNIGDRLRSRGGLTASMMRANGTC